MVQGYLANEKPPHPRTLQQACAQGPMVVLMGVSVSHERGTPEHAGRVVEDKYWTNS